MVAPQRACWPISTRRSQTVDTKEKLEALLKKPFQDRRRLGKSETTLRPATSCSASPA